MTTSSSGGQRAESQSGRTTSAARRVACSGCGVPGGDRGAVADLEVTRLVADRHGQVTAAHFCRSCQPAGAVGELACASCDDGPLLAGALVGPADLETVAALDEWLAETGWRPSGPWCPECARWVTRGRTHPTVTWDADEGTSGPIDLTARAIVD